MVGRKKRNIRSCKIEFPENNIQRKTHIVMVEGTHVRARDKQIIIYYYVLFHFPPLGPKIVYAITDCSYYYFESTLGRIYIRLFLGVRRQTHVETCVFPQRTIASILYCRRPLWRQANSTTRGRLLYAYYTTILLPNVNR